MSASSLLSSRFEPHARFPSIAACGRANHVQFCKFEAKFEQMAAMAARTSAALIQVALASVMIASCMTASLFLRSALLAVWCRSTWSHAATNSVRIAMAASRAVPRPFRGSGFGLF